MVSTVLLSCCKELPVIMKSMIAISSLLLVFILLEGVDSTKAMEVQEQDNATNSELFKESGWVRTQQKYQQWMRGELNASRNANTDTVCLERNIWFVWDSKNRSCECGDDVSGVVHCETATEELSVLDCYCLTLDYTAQGQPLPVAGSCIFNCANDTHVDIMYHNAPTDCASLNRQGTLCGQCMDGYAVPAYSYNLKCIKCNRDHESLGHYILFAFVPLTIFIVIILVFRINVLSPKLNMFVLASQIISTPIFLRILLYSISQKRRKILSIYVKTASTLYGIWNLDFLRGDILPEVCINVIPLHILVLDYLVAVYPMLLMAVAYTVVQLHDSGFRPLLYIWKPFHRYFVRFRRQWGIQTTIMDAFVTFFFLSTTKLFSVSFDLLIGTRLYTRDGKVYSWQLYYDPSIKYFGTQHLPYALLAIGILAVFIIFPTSLLIFYQCKPYQKCLKKCLIEGTILDEFINAFHKYYKDGSKGKLDRRWFAGFFILLKLFVYISYALSIGEMSYVFAVLLCTIGAIAIIIVEPYKEEYEVFNVISANFLLWLSLFFAIFTAALSYGESTGDVKLIVGLVPSLFPFTYIIVVILHHFMKRFRRNRGVRTLSISLPDRLLHSEDYRDSFGFIAKLPLSTTSHENTQ